MKLAYNTLHIHGDNIVECERALVMVTDALSGNVVSVNLVGNSVVCPSYTINLGNGDFIAVTFYPGFGRWNHDILTSIQERGGVLREAADVIVTGVENDFEHPLFAVEFCGALPAGNQAWQRSGRAYSFGAVKIPYLYISELGGYELDGNRQRKAARMPNPAVPFSYLSFSVERNTPVFPIFITAPGADEDSRKLYDGEFADSDVSEMIGAILQSKDITGISKKLQLKILSFIKKRGDAGRGTETLSGDQWQAAYDQVVKGNSVSSYLLENVRQVWSKTAYIEALTDNAKKLMALGKKHGIGLTSTKLPMCLLDAKSRAQFLTSLQKMYPNLEDTFIAWMEKSEPLAICWVMGFKPRGDDARPDRGLPPLARMLVGTDHDMMTIVYGPAPASTWPVLESSPLTLAKRNGLWEAILETSDALFVESATDTITRKGFTGGHWHQKLPDVTPSSFFISPRPTRFSENDVDTALHLLLSRMVGKDIFEGMCNPPGGDWSGVSILTSDHMTELRWISLPRVSGPLTKRPDHVFQVFKSDQKDIILSIESKETPQTLETGIGPRLTAYLTYLFSSPASIERPLNSASWCHSLQSIVGNEYRFASAGAFLSADRARVMDAVKRSNADLTFSVEFLAGGTRCDIEIIVSSEIGGEIADQLMGGMSDDSNIHLKKTSVI